MSVNDLHRHFATPGRRANDRADPEALADWLEANRESLAVEADTLMLAWKGFTEAAAKAAGKIRQARRQEHRGEP